MQRLLKLRMMLWTWSRSLQTSKDSSGGLKCDSSSPHCDQQFRRDGLRHPKKGQGGWVRDQQIDPESKYGYAYEVNGRYRAGCTYCSCANGRAMQSLAADGAKEAIFLTTRACYDPEFMGGQFNDCHPVWFIHDEIGFEIPEGRLSKMKLRGSKS
mgnify:CR=1 FL=1